MLPAEGRTREAGAANMLACIILHMQQLVLAGGLVAVCKPCGLSIQKRLAGVGMQSMSVHA